MHYILQTYWGMFVGVAQVSHMSGIGYAPELGCEAEGDVQAARGGEMIVIIMI